MDFLANIDLEVSPKKRAGLRIDNRYVCSLEFCNVLFALVVIEKVSTIEVDSIVEYRGED